MAAAQLEVPSGKRKISVNGGGSSPVWSPVGSKLYVLPDLRGKGINDGGSHKAASWDLGPDGERMLMIVSTRPDAPSQINVILNWFEELKERVPTRGR